MTPEQAHRRTQLLIKLEHGINQMALRYGSTYALVATTEYRTDEYGRAERAMDRRFKAIQRLTRALANLADGA